MKTLFCILMIGMVTAQLVQPAQASYEQYESMKGQKSGEKGSSAKSKRTPIPMRSPSVQLQPSSAPPTPRPLGSRDHAR